MRSHLFSALALIPASISAPAQTPGAPLRMEAHLFRSNDGRTVEAELGTLRVPLRQAHPKGPVPKPPRAAPSLDLRFVRFKSTNPKPGAPIVYLAGGPGGSGIEAARGKRLELFLALREVGDVIALDQRGTGESNPHPSLSQAWAVPLEVPVDEAGLNAAAESAARTAAKAWSAAGVDLGAFTTLESVGDLEALRRALGSPKLSLWGISYGTHLGLAYLRVHPDRVDRAILAGIEGPDDTWKLPSRAEALLARWEALLPVSPKPLRARLKAAGELIVLWVGRSPRPPTTDGAISAWSSRARRSNAAGSKRPPSACPSRTRYRAAYTSSAIRRCTSGHVGPTFACSTSVLAPNIGSPPGGPPRPAGGTAPGGIGEAPNAKL